MIYILFCMLYERMYFDKPCLSAPPLSYFPLLSFNQQLSAQKIFKAGFIYFLGLPTSPPQPSLLWFALTSSAYLLCKQQNKTGAPLPGRLLQFIYKKLRQIKTVKVHHLIPGGNKILYKFFLSIFAAINFCNCSKF
jgi:hypothetical protein